MKRLTNVVLLSVLALLAGCGGGQVGRPQEGPGPTPGPPSSGPSLTGNWQITATSAVSGTPPATIAGSITQSGSSLNGAVHVDGSNCFDHLTTIGLTGNLTGNNVSLTAAPVEGQVITLAGNISNNALTGTYAINGGCANGDQGNITGLNVPSFSGQWRIIFDVNDQHLGFGIATLTQGSAGSEGSRGISGAATNSISGSSCYSGSITSGTFPSPSYVIGTSVKLEMTTTDGGTVSFTGALKDDGEISGYHQVVGGICDGYFGGACLGRNIHASCHVPF